MKRVDEGAVDTVLQRAQLEALYGAPVQLISDQDRRMPYWLKHHGQLNYLCARNHRRAARRYGEEDGRRGPWSQLRLRLLFDDAGFGSDLANDVDQLPRFEGF